MSRFDRAFLVAQMGGMGRPEPAIVFEGGTKREIERNLERLVAEGVAVRTEHSTYCSQCGSDSGVEYRYALKRKP